MSQNYIVKQFKDVQLIERAEKIVTLSPKEAAGAAEQTTRTYFSKDGICVVFTLPAKNPREVATELDAVL
jgi:hypothetical protein